MADHAPQRIDSQSLVDFGTSVYASVGLPEPDARLVADTLVQADLWGHQSHGVLRLGWYYDRVRNGVIKPVTTPEFVTDAGSVAIIDGHDGVGHVLAMLATREAIRRARISRHRRRRRPQFQSFRHMHVLHIDRRARRLRDATHQ